MNGYKPCLFLVYRRSCLYNSPGWRKARGEDESGKPGEMMLSVGDDYLRLLSFGWPQDIKCFFVQCKLIIPACLDVSTT